VVDWDQLALDLDGANESPSTASSREKPKPLPLCGPCLAESMRWLDTSPVSLLPRLGIAYGSGADYDVSETGMRERRSARHAEWAATVRFQRRLVAEGCRAGRHSGA
jgi:hypothetical protein